MGKNTKIGTATPDRDDCIGCEQWGSHGWIVVNGQSQLCPVCVGSGKKTERYVANPPTYAPIWVDPNYWHPYPQYPTYPYIWCDNGTGTASESITSSASTYTINPKGN